MSRYSLRELKRQMATRRPRLRILIVSEGAKTEGLYISMFVQVARAANVEMRVFGRECGTDPLTVVQFAESEFRRDSGYDLCYCIIDRDRHDPSRFADAIQLGRTINARSRARSFDVIVSYPCIEFWFLLHFVYSRAPFVESGGDPLATWRRQNSESIFRTMTKPALIASYRSWNVPMRRFRIP